MTTAQRSTKAPTSYQSPSRANSRSGFTVIELLIAITVISILVAFLLAGVSKARAAARSVTCQNNVRQVALAFQSAEESLGGFPSGSHYMREIYPFADARPLADALKAGSGSARDGDFPSPAWLVCPDDSLTEISWGDTSYMQSDGVSQALVGNGGQGIYRLSQDVVSLEQIDDGLSNTVLVSERLVAPFFYPNRPAASSNDAYVRAHSIRYHFWFPASIPVFDDLDPFVDECRLVDPKTSKWYPIDKNPLLSRLWHQCSTGFNHVDPPNSTSCYRGVRTAGEPVNPTVTGSTPATSHHSGFVVAATCDGSVRTVSDFIDADLWRAVGTTSGAERDTAF